jgi:ADP-ribosylglycohydrolase
MKHQTKTIIGAIAGDVIGSIYEWHNNISTEFPLFVNSMFKKSDFTDDTVLTMAVADCVLNQKGGIAAAFYKHIPDEITEGVIARLPLEFVELLEAFEAKFNAS